jgi:hypothetical protein
MNPTFPAISARFPKLHTLTFLFSSPHNPQVPGARGTAPNNGLPLVKSKIA